MDEVIDVAPLRKELAKLFVESFTMKKEISISICLESNSYVLGLNQAIGSLHATGTTECRTAETIGHFHTHIHAAATPSIADVMDIYVESIARGWRYLGVLSRLGISIYVIAGGKDATALLDAIRTEGVTSVDDVRAKKDIFQPFVDKLAVSRSPFLDFSVVSPWERDDFSLADTEIVEGITKDSEGLLFVSSAKLTDVLYKEMELKQVAEV